MMERRRCWRIAFTRPAPDGRSGVMVTLEQPTTIVADLTARGFTAVTVTELPLAVGYGDLAAFIARDELAEARAKALALLTAEERQLLGLGF